MASSIATGFTEEPTGLSDRLRRRTRALHAQADRSGIVAAIIAGKATLPSYALFLRNLLAAYETMERELEKHQRTPGVGRVVCTQVFRSMALKADLATLHGPGWRDDLPVLPAAASYARRIATSSLEGGGGLLAHAYVRYLGDLNGGRVLKSLLAKSLGLGPPALAFYEFPEIDDLPAFRADYRQRLDIAGDEVADIDAVVEEGLAAFEMNIALSNAVAAA